jgi:hypothetical protein
VPNSDLIDLDPATVMDVKMDKMRKDLQVAHELASHNHPLSHYKELLQQFQEDLMEQEKAKEAKAAAKATPKGKKAKAAAGEDGDVDMDDAADEDGTPPKEKKSAKKRKAEDTAEVCFAKHLPVYEVANGCADSRQIRLCQEAKDQADDELDAQD